jgi:hypothetical protein
VKIKILVLFLSLFIGLTIISNAHADDNRLDKPFGLYAGVLSDPVITLLSLNAAYNVTDYLRLTGGVGFCPNGSYSATEYNNGSYTTQSGYTVAYVVGMGAKAFLPHLEFSPEIGLAVSDFVGPISGSSSENILFVCANTGFDYQAKDGFDIGLEFSVPLATISGQTQYVFFVVPGINIGKFF